MNKILALIPVMFALLALMVSPSVLEISAVKGGNDKAKGVPQGCENDKGKDAINNPNCGTSPCDLDLDGFIFSSELATHLSISEGNESTPGTAAYIIHLAESAANADGVGSHDQGIDKSEIPYLNPEISAAGYSNLC